MPLHFRPLGRLGQVFDTYSFCTDSQQLTRLLDAKMATQWGHHGPLCRMSLRSAGDAGTKTLLWPAEYPPFLGVQTAIPGPPATFLHPMQATAPAYPTPSTRRS